jgi:hypothetical protein
LPEALDNTPENTKGFYLGEKTMTDGLKLGLFYYKISAAGVAHKRVGLRNLVKTFINSRYGVAAWRQGGVSQKFARARTLEIPTKLSAGAHPACRKTACCMQGILIQSLYFFLDFSNNLFVCNFAV